MAETNTQTIIQEAEQFQTHCELLDAELTRASEEVDEFRSLMAEDFALRALAMAPRAPWPLAGSNVTAPNALDLLASERYIVSSADEKALRCFIGDGRNGFSAGCIYRIHSYRGFRPLSDQVLVRPLPPSNRMSSQSRVFMPANVDRGRLDNRLGVVLALGPGDPVSLKCDDCGGSGQFDEIEDDIKCDACVDGYLPHSRTPFEVQVGDTILYAPRGWAEIQLHGEDLIVIHDCQGILAVVDPDAVLFAEDTTTKKKGPGWS